MPNFWARQVKLNANRETKVDKTIGKLRAGEHVTIVALGDSNTELTFHTQGRLNWCGLLGEAIFETYGNGTCTLVNAGKCGSTVRESLTRLDRDALRFSPDLVILALGMNDAGGGLARLETFRTEVREIIGRIRQQGAEVLVRTPNPIVVVNGLPPPPEQARPGRAWESAARPVKAYAEALVAVAGEAGCPVVDHYRLWTERAYTAVRPVADPNGLWPRMSDAIHPGYLGHLAFFRELAPLFGVSSRFPWEE